MPSASEHLPSPTRRADTSQRDAAALHQRIACAAIDLARLGPKLAGVAASLEQHARQQAGHAEQIAGTVERLSRDLLAAVGDLRSSCAQVDGALATVDRIADETRILSINASIEAARAGVHGRAFSVVVQEVQSLAERTSGTTTEIEQRMRDMVGSISRVAEVAARPAEAKTRDSAPSVEGASGEVRDMASMAKAQLSHASDVHSLSEQAQRLAEGLLLAVGEFRFAAHQKAESLVAAVLPDLAAVLGSAQELEARLEAWLLAHPIFEVAYVTDASGRQITANLHWHDGRVRREIAGRGRDWSSRSWYRDACREDGAVSSDVYRSAASGDFCLTVSSGMRSKSGTLLAVLGADLSFERLLDRADRS